MSLSEAEPVMDINLSLARGKFSIDDAFDLRVKAIEIGNEAAVLWEGLSEGHRHVLSEIMKRTLEVMHENVALWLPNVITGGSGDMLTMTASVLMTKIDEQVDIINAANNFEKDAARRQMIEELVGEAEPVTDEQFVDQVREYLNHGSQVPNRAIERLLDMIEK